MRHVKTASASASIGKEVYIPIWWPESEECFDQYITKLMCVWCPLLQYLAGWEKVRLFVCYINLTLSCSRLRTTSWLLYPSCWICHSILTIIGFPALASKYEGKFLNYLSLIHVFCDSFVLQILMCVSRNIFEKWKAFVDWRFCQSM